MRIVIDSRLYSQAGVGRYLQKLIENLALIDKKNKYIIFLKKDDFFVFQPPAKNFEKRLVNISWHSLAEQLFLPLYLIKERPDLVHFPYFSVPIFYPGKFLVTIHDLTVDHFATGKASTHHPFTYWTKRLFYKLVVSFATRRARAIIAVSESTKREIISHYRIAAGKISVIYEAADFSKTKRASEPIVPSSYLLYVGNAYPHKNLENLIAAFELLGRQFNKLKLVLVGKKDFFYQRLEKQKKDIVFFGPANDEQLANLYAYAQTFVFPSLMEGFGLPGLEAMATGLPVVCSDIPVFEEIYRNAALYFDPNDPEDIVTKIKKVIQDRQLRAKMIELGRTQVKKYSWAKMAKETIEIYNLVGRS